MKTRWNRARAHETRERRTYRSRSTSTASSAGPPKCACGGLAQHKQCGINYGVPRLACTTREKGSRGGQLTQRERMCERGVKGNNSGSPPHLQGARSAHGNLQARPAKSAHTSAGAETTKATPLRGNKGPRSDRKEDVSRNRNSHVRRDNSTRSLYTLFSSDLCLFANTPGHAGRSGGPSGRGKEKRKRTSDGGEGGSCGMG